MLNEHICKANKVSNRSDFRAEARFYLAENDYDFRKAANAYDTDLKLEQEILKKKWSLI